MIRRLTVEWKHKISINKKDHRDLCSKKGRLARNLRIRFYIIPDLNGNDLRNTEGPLHSHKSTSVVSNKEGMDGSYTVVLNHAVG